MDFLNLDRLSFGYIKQQLLLVDINASSDFGNIFLFGQKESGKTSFLQLLCGMQQHYFGQILVDGKPPKDSTMSITYLPDEVVALKNKTIKQNLEFACDSINQSYDKIDFNNSWISKHINLKFKKLSALDKLLFAINRAKIKNSKLLLIDVSLKNLTEEDIKIYSSALLDLLADKTKLIIISVSCSDYKKLNLKAAVEKIWYLFVGKLNKYESIEKCQNSLDYLGLAEYFYDDFIDGKITNSINGYLLHLDNRTIKLEDDVIANIIEYFTDIDSFAEVRIFGDKFDNNISDNDFNDALKNSSILMFDKISTLRLR